MGKYINEDIAEEDDLFFGWSSGSIHKNLIYYHKGRNNNLKAKSPVTESSKLKPNKFLDVVI